MKRRPLHGIFVARVAAVAALANAQGVPLRRALRLASVHLGLPEFVSHPASLRFQERKCRNLLSLAQDILEASGTVPRG